MSQKVNAGHAGHSRIEEQAAAKTYAGISDMDPSACSVQTGEWPRDVPTAYVAYAQVTHRVLATPAPTPTSAERLPPVTTLRGDTSAAGRRPRAPP